ncbi:MAG: MogA/MoaB family molybdenum cofactor biosynthesis protein [Phycisphaeraceae bacterium]|nr:MogA/MoaB family molybdenum cofactor biosynthesis protein [Phycisphaeraceae bacterium]
MPIRAAVLTISDRCSRAEREDLSGPALRAILTGKLAAQIAAFDIVSDDPDAIANQLVAWSHPDQKIDLILTTGGTGLAPRDNTPEAAKRVVEREHPGLLELARRRCYEKTPKTYLSRGISGTRNRTLIITLPGSPRGAGEMLEALLDVLPHAMETLRGEVTDG